MSVWQKKWPWLALFGALLISTCWLGARDFYLGQRLLGLSRLQWQIFGGLAVFWACYEALPGFRIAVRGADVRLLTLLQTFRVMGAAILMAWGLGHLPGGFALPMALLDMSVGVMALLAMVALDRHRPFARRLVRWTHIWSLADFAVTIGLAIFAFRALPIDPPPVSGGYAHLAALPVLLLPAVAIVTFSWISFAALTAMKHQARS